MHPYFDQNGLKVELGREIGRGGEAVAYELLSDPTKVVKVYHELADPWKSEKLLAMTKIANHEIARFAAWPHATIKITRSGPIAGVVMPRVSGVEIHKLYNPSSRKSFFPNADWRFLIRTASNYATAIEHLHRRGIVIGDINQANALVSDDAIVRFIDCDSFQIRTSEKIFRCPVGVPHFTPPELQSKRFDDRDRTVNHDRFGLAIMVFHLLFAGRHPFAGRYSGSANPSLEEKIKDYRFAFGRDHTRYQVEPPPFTPLLCDVPYELAELFENAFEPSAESGSRPTAAAWQDSLRKFELNLTQCRDDPGHYYLPVNQCPWCRIVNEGGPNIFLSASYSRTQDQLSSFDHNALAKAIKDFPIDLESRIFYNPQKLNFSPAMAKHENDVVSPETFLFLKIMMAACLIGMVLFCCLGVLAGTAVFTFASFILFLTLVYLNRNYISNELEIAKINREEELRLQGIRRDLFSKIKAAEKFLQLEKDGILKQLNKLKGLDSERANAFRRLESQAEQRQLEDHLSNFLICDAKLPGIGPARVATLESYGIDSALEINREILEKIPGFGASLIATLLAWQAILTDLFQFDRLKGIPERDRRSIDHRYNQQKVRLQKLLIDSPKVLRKAWEAKRSEIQNFIRLEKLD